MEPPLLDFRVDAARAERAATPTIALTLLVRADGDRPVQSLLLQAQVRIAVARRPHDAATRERLRPLFGEPKAWRESARSLLWTQVVSVVPGFAGETRSDLLLPCSYDFEVGWAVYLDAVRDGTLPLDLMFSGTVFYPDEDGRLHASRLPWDREARFDLPVPLVRESLEQCFPGSAWVRVGRETRDRLAAFKAREALPTWDRALDALLPREPPPERPPEPRWIRSRH